MTDVMRLYAEYAACLDDGRLDDWPKLFTQDCHYRIVPRENHERGLPLAAVDLVGRDILLDRVYAASSTLFHAPYYQRHIIGPARVTHDGPEIGAEANYLVIRTKRDRPSEVAREASVATKSSTHGASIGWSSPPTSALPSAPSSIGS